MFTQIRKTLSTPAAVRIVRGLASASVLRMLAMAMGFFATVLLARLLGAREFGIYGACMSVAVVAALPVDLGGAQLLIRKVSAAVAHGNWSDIGLAIRSATRLKWILGTVTSVILVLSVTLLSERISQGALIATLLAIAAIVPIVTLKQGQGVMLGLQRYVISEIPESLVRTSTILVTAVLALLLHKKANIQISSAHAMMFFLLAAILGSAAAQLLLRRALPPIALERQALSGRSWAKQALPFGLGESLRVLQGHIPVLLTGLLLSAQDIGYFRIALSLLGLVSLPMSVIAIVIAPVISQLEARGDQRNLRKITVWTSFTTFGFMIFCCAPLFIAGDRLVALAFGEDFVSAVIPIQILLTGGIVGAMFGQPFAKLNMTGNERVVVHIFIISSAFQLFATLSLGRLFGVVGVAVATAMTLALLSWLGWVKVKSLLNLDTSVFSLFKYS